MPAPLDLEGRKFGRLTVRMLAGTNHRNYRMWLCDCDCGCVTLVPSDRLVKSTRSCGCLQREQQKARMTRHGETTYFYKTRLYGIWCNMRGRCRQTNNPQFKDYGGRGIVVCAEWRDFAVFRRWAEESGYTDELSIDRIDVNGNYEPSNCRWATRAQQALNKRNTSFIEINGEKMPTHTIARNYGLPSGVVRWRMKKGWPLERVLEPIK